MLKLNKPAGPQRIVLRPAQGVEGEEGFEPEAFVVLAPITPAMRRRAQTAMRRNLDGVSDLAELDLDRLGDIGEVASRELIRLGLVEWGGIGDESGAPLELTPDRDTRFATANADDRPTGTIDDFLADEDLFERLDREYVRPDAVRRAEKNGLSALPNGTGKAATPGSAIASSPAKPKRAAAAKNARTRKTRSRRKPAKASGRS